jgi:hypothetical protein
VITEYTLPSANSHPADITAGPDGNLWFTEDYSNNVGRITPAGVISEYAVPTGYSHPTCITAGPDGNLWFTEGGTDKIGSITTSGIFTEYQVLQQDSRAKGITAGPDGNVWFVEAFANSIGRFALVITPTPTPIQTQTPGGPTATDTPTVCTLEFTDVPRGSTFYPYIRCMACRGIVSGYTTGCTTGSPCFRPNNNVSRGQLAKLVSNSAGFQDPPTGQSFQDVAIGSAFYDYVYRLGSRGITSGYICGGAGEPCVGPDNLPYFRPGGNATRGQISKIVSNTAGFQEPPVGQTFEDVAPGSTFYDFIQRLTVRSIMQGYACGGVGEPCVAPDNRAYFRPNNNATRGQASKALSNTFFPNCQTP